MAAFSLLVGTKSQPSFKSINDTFFRYALAFINSLELTQDAVVRDLLLNVSVRETGSGM